MTTPAPPLTEAELDSMANMRSSLWPFSWASRVIAQARRALALESELAQLRREKAEREGLERRRDALLSASAFHQVRHDFDSDLAEHTVALVDWEGAELGTGPTYEAALAAALAKLEKP